MKQFCLNSLLFLYFISTTQAADLTQEYRKIVEDSKHKFLDEGSPCTLDDSRLLAKKKKVVKVFDGMSAYCRNKADVERYKKSGMYKVRGPKVLKINKADITFEFQIIFLSCQEIEPGHFAMLKQQDPFHFFYEHMGNTIEVHQKDVSLSIYRDGKWTKSYKEKVMPGGNGTWIVHSTINLDHFLTKNEKKDLGKGEKVEIAFDYKKIGVENVHRADSDEEGYNHSFHGGAFRAFYELQIKNRKIHLKKLTKKH